MENIKTKLQDMIDPEVLTDMVLAELPEKIRFTGVAPIDTTLQGVAGSTVTVPAYKYIGDAHAVGEGETYPIDKLETSTEEFTIQKYGKAVAITDESILSGYGNPAGEIQRQLVMAVSNKVDNEILETIKEAPVSVDAPIDATMVDAIEEVFLDEDQEFGVIFMNPKDAVKLKSNAMDAYQRASALGDEVLVKGIFGEVLGWQIVRSRKVDEGEAYAVKSGAMKIFMKRGLNHELIREGLNDNTIFKANLHGGVALVDDSRLLKINLQDAPASE